MQSSFVRVAVFIITITELSLLPLSRTRIWCLPLFLLALASSASAKERPIWPVPALSSFNGASWGNLQLGRTTFKQVQQNYETGKGAYERSTELSQPKNSPVRIDCLWNKSGGDEVLAAVTVRFAGNGPDRSELQRLFDPENEKSQELYQEGRYEDWRVVNYTDRGIAAFSLRSGDLENVPLLVLSSPNSLGALRQSLTKTQMPVEERIDPNADRERVMEFGTIDIDLDDDLDLSESERWRTRDRIKDAEADGTIRYYRRGEGTYRVDMEGSKKKDGGSVYVTVTISGEGPYGSLSASGSGSDTWKWRNKNKTNHDDEQSQVVDSYRAALRDARRAAESKFAQAMRNAGPPPLASIREEQWVKLVNSIREANTQLGSGIGILR